MQKASVVMTFELSVDISSRLKNWSIKCGFSSPRFLRIVDAKLHPIGTGRVVSPRRDSVVPSYSHYPF